METQVKMYHFFVGGNRFETDKSFLTGTEIKMLAGVRAEYQLFYRDDVNTPDREVRDTQAVDLIPHKEEDGTADKRSRTMRPSNWTMCPTITGTSMRCRTTAIGV
jgi:hypothetical protein